MEVLYDFILLAVPESCAIRMLVDPGCSNENRDRCRPVFSLVEDPDDSSSAISYQVRKMGVRRKQGSTIL